MESNINKQLSDEVGNKLDELFPENNSNKNITKQKKAAGMSESKRQLDGAVGKSGIKHAKASNKRDISDEPQSRLDELSDEEKKNIQAEENEKILKALKDSADKLLQERADSERRNEKKTENSSLIIKELKEAVLSIDWEITDPAVDKFMLETERLRDVYQKDDTLSKFFRLLGSLGKHVKDKRADAHPEAIKLLHSIYESLEKVFMSGDMTKDMKKKILTEKIERFKRLKEQLISTKAISGEKTEKTEENGNLSKTKKETAKTVTTNALIDDMKGNSDFKEIADSLKELNRTIQNEFRALRAELRLLRQKNDD